VITDAWTFDVPDLLHPCGNRTYHFLGVADVLRRRPWHLPSSLGRMGELAAYLGHSVLLRSSIAKRGVDIAHQEEQRMIAKHESIEATKYCSLMQLTEAMFEVGGQYRRNVDGHYPGISKSA